MYVYDIIVTRSNQDLINTFIKALSLYFLVEVLGPLHFFLGIEVTRTNASLLLSQYKYIYDLLERSNMYLSKSVSTPMDIIEKLSTLDGCTFDDSQWY